MLLVFLDNGLLLGILDGARAEITNDGDGLTGGDAAHYQTARQNSARATNSGDTVYRYRYLLIHISSNHLYRLIDLRNGWSGEIGDRDMLYLHSKLRKLPGWQGFGGEVEQRLHAFLLQDHQRIQGIG